MDRTCSYHRLRLWADQYFRERQPRGESHGSRKWFGTPACMRRTNGERVPKYTVRLWASFDNPEQQPDFHEDLRAGRNCWGIGGTRRNPPKTVSGAGFGMFY